MINHMAGDNKWKQKPLLPKQLKEEEASYKAVIDLQEALANENISNIALTGPFGAGKSSVISTLIVKEKDNKSLCFLPISLATLDAITDNNGIVGNNQYNKKNIDNETLNRRIEYSILQQLIYREKSETLPNSRLKRIPYISKNTIIKIAKCIITFVICFCIVFEPKWFKIEFLYRIFNWGYWINGICDTAALCIMIYMLYQSLIFIIKKYSNVKLNHLKVAGSEIQIKDENSIFNHHLDEILYFFQCTSYNVVIIEDLDRFNTTDIFFKLRELNYLLNHSKIVGRSIKFIYAIKDDMFTDSSRTKFFDYITTVIPVISPYNSKDILRNTLIELGHSDEVNDKTIKEVAFFIDDMRLLQNIANEYHQYRLRLGCGDNHKIDNNKLLAMIVYKNYFPRDFALLPARDGKVYSALCQTNRRKCVDFAIEDLQKRKDTVIKSRNIYNATKHLKETELRKIYVYAYLTRINAAIHVSYRVNSICVDNIYHQISDCWNSEETFKKLITQNSIKYKYASSSTGTLNVKFSEIEKEIDSTMTFQERLNALVLGEDGISKEEDSIKMEETLITSYPMHKLINRYSLYNEAFYKDLNLPDMADRFIRTGLIAEDYYDYISYFYEGMVSVNDHNLILDMKLDRKPDYRIRINNVKTFLDEIPDDVFLTQSIYNIDLLDYLTKHKEEEEKRYNLFLHQLSNDLSFDFISSYYQEGEETKTLLTSYVHLNPQKLWRNIFKKSNNENLMLEIWFRFCSLEHIKEQQTKWITSHFEFMSSIYSKLQNEIKDYLVTNIKYDRLTENTIEMLDSVVKNNCYAVSKDNMPIIVKYKNAYNDINLLNIDEQSLAIQMELLNPIWKNISSYFINMDNAIDNNLWNFIENNASKIGFHMYDGNSDIKTLLFELLMGSNKLTFDAYQYISCSFEDTKLSLNNDIKSLEEERFCWLIKNGHIEYSDDNISFINTLSSDKIKYEYIIHNKSHFVDDVDEYIYNENLALLLLETSELTHKEKALLLTRLNTSNITMTVSLANAICDLLRIEAVEWDYTLLKKALKQATNKENVLRIVILTIGNNKNNHTIITELLQLMPETYSKITENGERPIINITELNKLLLDTLIESNYISSYSEEEKKGYRINTKQKN